MSFIPPILLPNSKKAIKRISYLQKNFYLYTLNFYKNTAWLLPLKKSVQRKNLRHLYGSTTSYTKRILIPYPTCTMIAAGRPAAVPGAARCRSSRTPGDTVAKRGDSLRLRYVWPESCGCRILYPDAGPAPCGDAGVGRRRGRSGAYRRPDVALRGTGSPDVVPSDRGGASFDDGGQ